MAKLSLNLRLMSTLSRADSRLNDLGVTTETTRCKGISTLPESGSSGDRLWWIYATERSGTSLATIE
jgi:hypothetical protein